jgi:hypothetical protein
MVRVRFDALSSADGQARQARHDGDGDAANPLRCDERPVGVARWRSGRIAARAFEALEYAVAQQWIEVSAVFDAIRLTPEGRRVLSR